ncbi:protein male-specific lethal-1-like isoform X2 [Argiope bruennichi]|uniref:protein male-specific lethal-1-like isoform X2 n=1 Tax=Argiope bruennichi TaxID=94029 RepID=UPI002494CAF1|nr:protein male-specific lethal-1-like isoform X2 [Argiope bruennichi]
MFIFNKARRYFEVIVSNWNKTRKRKLCLLRACLDRKQRKMCLVRRNCTKSDDDSTDNVLEGRSNFSNCEVPSVTASSTTAFISSGHPSVRTPVLATRYFGRRSKTVPSRALKRRYMGPPKTFPVKKLTIKSESSTASVSSTSEMNDIDCQKTLVPLEILEDGIITTGIRRVRKRRGRRPKRVPKNTDYLTTDKTYFLADLQPAPETLSSSEIHVPSWKLKPVTSFYQMEGTENINDSVFERRHQKFELDERRRKRWDIQRIRDQKALEKRRAREKEKSAKRKSLSLLPDLRHIEYIEVTEQLPVTAFGHLIPLFQPCEFCLPWNLRNNVVQDVSECPSAPPPPPPPCPSKGRRGRPAIAGPKVT